MVHTPSHHSAATCCMPRAAEHSSPPPALLPSLIGRSPVRMVVWALGSDVEAITPSWRPHRLLAQVTFKQHRPQAVRVSLSCDPSITGPRRDQNPAALTSPHPFADVTRRSAKLMEPPPLPFWVERLPDRMAVSVAVRGAYERIATSSK